MNVYVSLWILLLTVVAILALYRRVLAAGEYTILHVRKSELSLVPKQIVAAQKLERIDRWGKTMTVIAFLWGFALAVAWLYAGITRGGL